jgi:hypothetical protein
MNRKNRSKYELKRDSFSDRICDDLCEVLLKNLSFEDKICFECVSKQFQRCVFVKQNILEISNKKDNNNKLNKLLLKSENTSNERQIDLTAFESVLKKCKYINKIMISFDLKLSADKVLQLIAQNCENLKSIDFNFINISQNTLIEFADKCGQKLECIQFLQRDFNKSYKTLLNSCTNLLSLTAVKLSEFVIEDKKIFKRLTKISLICLISETQLLDNFFSQYKNTVKRFGIISGLNNTLDENTINALIKQISRFEKLEELYLEFNFMKGFNLSFAQNMKTIANQCKKIKRLSIHSIINNSLFGSEIFRSINNFESLKDLNLNIYHTLCNCGTEGISVQYIKDCKLLTHLVLNYPKLNDNFFTDIELYLPKLKFLCIYANIITDKTLHSLSKLKNLCLIQVNSLRPNQSFSSVTDIGVCHLINNCPTIKSIRFNRRPNITLETIEALIGLALEKPRIYFSHFFGSFKEENNEEFEEKFQNLIKSLPKNIEIKF